MPKLKAAVDVLTSASAMLEFILEITWCAAWVVAIVSETSWDGRPMVYERDPAWSAQVPGNRYGVTRIR